MIEDLALENIPVSTLRPSYQLETSADQRSETALDSVPVPQAKPQIIAALTQTPEQAKQSVADSTTNPVPDDRHSNEMREERDIGAQRSSSKNHRWPFKTGYGFDFSTRGVPSLALKMREKPTVVLAVSNRLGSPSYSPLQWNRGKLSTNSQISKLAGANTRSPNGISSSSCKPPQPRPLWRQETRRSGWTSKSAVIPT